MREEYKRGDSQQHPSAHNSQIPEFTSARDLDTMRDGYLSSISCDPAGREKKKEVIDDTAVLAHVSSTAALMRTEPPIDQKKGHIHTLIHPWK